MQNFELPFKIEGSEYNEVVLLEKYGDRYSIVLGQESRNGGTVYKKWCYPQRRVDNQNLPAEKAIPMRIPIGDRNQAIAIMQGMLAAFKNPQTAKTAPTNKDEIPF